jgi:Sec7-like guanine-nucleotide exchange factor
MKPNGSALIYFYLAGQCISTLAKTNYTLDLITSLVYLENSSNLESFETVSRITSSKRFGLHKGHNIAHTFDVAHSLTDNTV